MNNQETETTQTPDWVLERLLLGELPPAEMVRLQARLEVEPGLKERLEALEADNAATLEVLPPSEVRQEVERRARIARAAEAQRRHHRTSATPWWVPALAGAAAMLVAVLLSSVLFGDAGAPGVSGHPDAARPGWDGIKGDRLRIYRKTGANDEPLVSGQAVDAGDVIQVAYVPGGAERGVIVSVDGGGQVTRHFPDAPGGDNALDKGTLVPLPHSYELDDAPEFERFFFVFAAPGARLDTAEVEDAAWQLARSSDPETAPLPVDLEGVRVETLVLKKGGR